MNARDADLITVSCKQFILLELDYALAAYLFERNRRYLNEDQIEYFRRLPRHWLQEAESFLPEEDDCLILFEVFGMLQPGLAEQDYASASGWLRTLNHDKLRAAAGKLIDLAEEGRLSTEEIILAVIEKQIEPVVTLYQEFVHQDVLNRKTAKKMAALMDEPVLYLAFWRWVDQFMYEHYLPWRAGQGAAFEQPLALLAGLQVQDGKYALGELLNVLPRTNALLYRPKLRQFLREGVCELVIWQEPFGLFDSWSVLNGQIIISVSAPGSLFNYAKEEIFEIAEKSRALSDPTRLGILRIIRHFDMDITEMAEYFGVARPTVSVHIKKLREAGLITSFNDGRSVRHKLNMEKMQALFEELERFLDLE